MKRWFRPVAYSIIAVLALLALFGKPPAKPDTVAATSRAVPAGTAAERRNASGPVANAGIAGQRDDRLDPDLFGAPTPAQVVTAPTPDVAAPIVELKVLGWMTIDDAPVVFVQYNGENYTLSPGQTVEDVYRFDKIGGGSAEFTHLPTGQPRQYPVSDPTVLD